MADMGFLPQVRKLLDQVKPDGQRLLFSATLDRDVDTLVRQYLTNPVTHSIAPPSASVTTMEHHVLHVAPEDKAGVVADIGARDGRTILFVRTKHGADRLVKQLGRVGVRAGSLHGGKTQGARTRTLAQFREGQVPVLVATDVAARGVHVDDISLVVHVDPPADPKSYLHRAGRTARAGESGIVVTLVSPHQTREVDLLAKQAGITPARRRVTPGDSGLTALTGAKTPSGIAVAEAPESPARSGGRPSGGGRGGPRQPRSGGASRDAGEGGQSRYGRGGGSSSQPRTGGHGANGRTAAGFSAGAGRPRRSAVR
jgi:superfamily II DNA/RNA helicase